jgi:heme-degrading monooxygenase HmoA
MIGMILIRDAAGSQVSQGSGIHPPNGRNDMAHVKQQQQPVTMINVFTVEPDDQQALIDLLVQAKEQVLSKQAGYLSARIHRGLDGRKVAVYARWRSAEDFLALAENAEAAAHMRRARKLAAFEPVVYDVVLTDEADGALDEKLAG